VTAASKLGGKVVERIVEDTGAGRTTFSIYFRDGTELGWSYTDGGTFIKRPGEPVRDVY
jgi:hypothetical protein